VKIFYYTNEKYFSEKTCSNHRTNINFFKENTSILKTSGMLMKDTDAANIKVALNNNCW
jgi:hypothetical protein